MAFDSHANMVVDGQILQIGLTQRVEPEEAVGRGKLADEKQGTLRRIALIHGTTIGEPGKGGTKLIDGHLCIDSHAAV